MSVTTKRNPTSHHIMALELDSVFQSLTSAVEITSSYNQRMLSVVDGHTLQTFKERARGNAPTIDHRAAPITLSATVTALGPPIPVNVVTSPHKESQKPEIGRKEASTMGSADLLLREILPEYHIRQFERANRSPPQSRFTAVHHQQFARAQPLVKSPETKRQSNGEESPTKRRKAPNGSSIGILPTLPLQKLTLTEKERLTQVSKSRMRDRHRDLQLSPKKRQSRTYRPGFADNNLTELKTVLEPNRAAKNPITSLKRVQRPTSLFPNLESIPQLKSDSPTLKPSPTFSPKSAIRDTTEKSAKDIVPAASRRPGSVKPPSSVIQTLQYSSSSGDASLLGHASFENQRSLSRSAYPPLQRTVGTFSKSEASAAPKTMTPRIEPRTESGFARPPRAEILKSPSDIRRRVTTLPDSRKLQAPSKTANVISSRPAASLARSEPRKEHTKGTWAHDDLPSYARPTQATLRRSNSMKSKIGNSLSKVQTSSSLNNVSTHTKRQ